METKAKQKRKRHAESFKREAVRLLETRGERTVADVAAGLGVPENQLHAWKKAYGSAADRVRKELGVTMLLRTMRSGYLLPSNG